MILEQDLIIGAGALMMAAMLALFWSMTPPWLRPRHRRPALPDPHDVPTEPLRLGDIGGTGSAPITQPTPRPYAATRPLPVPPPFLLYVPGVPRLVAPAPPGHPDPVIPPWMTREPPAPAVRCRVCRDGLDVVGACCFRCGARPLSSGAPERRSPS